MLGNFQLLGGILGGAMALMGAPGPPDVRFTVSLDK